MGNGLQVRIWTVFVMQKGNNQSHLQCQKWATRAASMNAAAGGSRPAGFSAYLYET